MKPRKVYLALRDFDLIFSTDSFVKKYVQVLFHWTIFQEFKMKKKMHNAFTNCTYIACTMSILKRKYQYFSPYIFMLVFEPLQKILY